VREGVFEAVGVSVGIDVFVGVGVFVEVGTKSMKASNVNACTVFKFAKARSSKFSTLRAMGVGRVGSESAIAEVTQNMLKPSTLAKKIHSKLR